jgi:hypothetical protein
MASASFVLMWSCTDLEIEETDSIIAESSGEFTGVTDPAGSLDGLYNNTYGQLGNQANLYALNEVSTDEFVVPTRGVDWGDNGVWRTLHAHSWTPIHNYVLGTWNDLNSNIFNATTIIDDRSGASPQVVAEAKFLRAFSMFWILDLYRQIPFRTPDEGPDVNPTVLTAQEAVDFIAQDLNEAISDLPAIGPVGEDNRFASKASANFLLAKLLLNKHIYLGTPPDAGDMTGVVNAVDAIQADGYELQEGFFEIFTPDVDSETIWWARTGVGNRIWNTMHLTQNAPGQDGGGWNGWATLAEFYDLFEGPADTNAPGSGQEERRGFVPANENDGPLAPNLGIGYGLLIGQQYDNDGAKLKERSGNDLVFTKEFPGLVGNPERTGVRVIKYHPVNGAFTNHEIIFRYSDAHLMKAEAIQRGGSSGDDALALVNELRAIRGATPLGTLTEQDLLDERGRELYAEGTRRQDQIRFGKFAEAWDLKEASEEFRSVYPVPATALLSNPNLVQNPGYE